MPKLQRKSAKVFAEQAQARVGGVGQFGSLAAGNPQYSKDVDVIQALDAYKNGWSDAVVGNKSPAIEDRNALDYLLSYQQAYIMQHGIPEWLDTETYYENSYVVDSNGELRVSVIDNNTGHDPIDDEGGQYWGYAGARGAGKQIGEVYYSQSNLATDNKGALPLFTGELISNAENLYPQFYAWVLLHTELCKTQAEYDTAISTYGECPYYVINDTNKTIRLPKLTNYVKMANTTQGITQTSAGLPNIATPMYAENGIENNKMASGAGTAESVSWSASNFNPIYGRSNTVTPAHTTLYPWVCAYNGAAPASVAQAAQFQAALSSKADTDLSNVSATGKNTAIGWGMPDYSAGVSLTNDTDFTATKAGVAMCIVNNGDYDNLSDTHVYLNGVELWHIVGTSGGYVRCFLYIPLLPGDTIKIKMTRTNSTYLTFYPFRGA